MAAQEYSTDSHPDIPTPQPPHEDPCVVHRPLDMRGGGEEYALQLARALECPLYTYSCEIDTPDDVDVREFGEGSILDHLPADFTKFEYSDYSPPEHHDCVITTGSMALPTIHHPDQHRIHLQHTPARWLYDLNHRQDDNVLVRLYKAATRSYNETTTRRIDDWVTNSEIISRRLDTYYDHDTLDVIHPPVDTDDYHSRPGEGFLLYLGRLEPHKGVREIVEQISGTDYTLKVAGTGSLEDELREIAGENVTFLGYVDESRKKRLLARADALVFNSFREDFGIVPIEAMASGTPVIGVDEGFTTHQITDGVTGVLFERGGLLNAVERRYQQSFDPDWLMHEAEEYGLERFRDEWRRLIYGDE
jgi:glycosyltransferase involved in cell wall biosynthesis